MNELVFGELVAEFLQLGFTGQFAEYQQVGGFGKGRLLGQLFDRITAIAQNAVVTVDIANVALAGTGIAVTVVQRDKSGLGAQ